MAGWKYRDVNVQVPSTADIPTIYRFDKPLGRVVQEVLDSIDPWQEGEDPIETMRFPGRTFRCIVIPRGNAAATWAKHPGHHAKSVEASPFVVIDSKLPPRTNLFTVELVQTPERPKLVRAYPGDYIPPLPWMNSARWAEGGRSACVDFWKQHAYACHPAQVLRGRSSNPPAWFTH